jgi:tRNA(Ile2) C34 agmatinyltransferase TiaS
MAERVITVTRRLKLTPRTCPVCGRGFEGWGRATYCSRPCVQKADYRRHAEARRAARRERYRRRKAAEEGGPESADGPGR